MDPADYLAQCAQEDQAMLDEYVANRPVSASSPSDTASNGDDTPSRSHGKPLQPFHVSTRLIWGCAMAGCYKAKELTSCPACEAVQYCSQEHQVLDRAGHRSVCAKIKRTHASYRKEEKSLRRRFGDEILELEWGLFWRTGESREYMRVRRMLVEALLKSNTAQAITLSLDHLFDMLRLWRSDDIGARDIVPPLLIRLGRLQEAYDFCSWWSTTGQEDYEWRDVRAPYLDTKDANVFEDVGVFTQNARNLPHLVAVTLLKIRLLIDLHSIQRAREQVGPHVPREILDTIQRHSINSVIAGESKVIERDNQTPHVAELHKQVKALYVAVTKANPHFWPALIEPGEHLTARPIFYRQGDEAQMRFVLQQNYNAWSETPGAISIIEELSNSCPVVSRS